MRQIRRQISSVSAAAFEGSARTRPSASEQSRAHVQRTAAVAANTAAAEEAEGRGQRQTCLASSSSRCRFRCAWLGPWRRPLSVPPTPPWYLLHTPARPICTPRALRYTALQLPEMCWRRGPGDSTSPVGYARGGSARAGVHLRVLVRLSALPGRFLGVLVGLPSLPGWLFAVLLWLRDASYNDAACQGFRLWRLFVDCRRAVVWSTATRNNQAGHRGPGGAAVSVKGYTTPYTIRYHIYPVSLPPPARSAIAGCLCAK